MPQQGRRSAAAQGRRAGLASTGLGSDGASQLLAIGENPEEAKAQLRRLLAEDLHRPHQESLTFHSWGGVEVEREAPTHGRIKKTRMAATARISPQNQPPIQK